MTDAGNYDFAISKYFAVVLCSCLKNLNSLDAPNVAIEKLQLILLF